jgi:capsular polysaccharide biosynthesis protein
MEIKLFLQLLLKRWWIMLIIIVVTIISTLIFTRYQTETYSSSVTYVVSPSPEILNGTNFLSGLSVLGGQPTVANTYASIATSAIIKQNAIDALGISLSQASNLDVDSRVQSGTNVIEITVEGPDPLLVQTFANKIGESTVDYVKKFDSVYDLIILDSAKAPDRPIRPNLRLNLVLGLALGFSLAGGLVLLSGMNEY